MAKKKPDWFAVQDRAWSRYAGDRANGVRWPGPSYAIAEPAFRSGFAAGLRAMARRLKAAEKGSR